MEPFLYDEFYAIESTHWWPVGMRGVFHMLLERSLRGVPRPRLLDVGCGTGIALEEFSRYGSICGLDLAWPAVTYSRRRNPEAALVQGDLLRLPFATASVDAVLAFDVIEHLADDRAGLQELYRVLAPAGVALVNVPAFPSLWSGKDVANHHYRRYTRRVLAQRIRGVGFAIERLTFTDAGLFPAIWCWRRLQRAARMNWDSHGEFHPPAWLNRMLLGSLRLERRLLQHLDFPFGTSLTCVARRPGGD